MPSAASPSSKVVAEGVRNSNIVALGLVIMYDCCAGTVACNGMNRGAAIAAAGEGVVCDDGVPLAAASLDVASVAIFFFVGARREVRQHGRRTIM